MEVSEKRWKCRKIGWIKTGCVPFKIENFVSHFANVCEFSWNFRVELIWLMVYIYNHTRELNVHSNDKFSRVYTSKSGANKYDIRAMLFSVHRWLWNMHILRKICRNGVCSCDSNSVSVVWRSIAMHTASNLINLFHVEKYWTKKRLGEQKRQQYWWKQNWIDNQIQKEWHFYEVEPEQRPIYSFKPKEKKPWQRQRQQDHPNKSRNTKEKTNLNHHLSSVVTAASKFQLWRATSRHGCHLCALTNE